MYPGRVQKGGYALMLINVKSGQNEVPLSVSEGTTVAQVREATAKHLNTEADYQAWFKTDGEKPILIAADQEAGTVVTINSTVEFVKPSGSKG